MAFLPRGLNFLAMENTSIKPDKFFRTACYFEGSLIIIALFFGWVADINPFETIHFSENAIIYGLLGALPLFLIFLAMEQMNIASVQKIRKVLVTTIGPSMRGYNWADLFIMATVVGVSEEILFRGVLQPWMENSWGLTIGLIGSSLLFGLVHAVTPLYVVLATSVGIYLGLFLDYADERNLLIPIIIHSVYDFLAFIAIIKAYKTKASAD